ncbi:MAG: hypothetical protein ACE5I1_33435 [bacterium]
MKKLAIIVFALLLSQAVIAQNFIGPHGFLTFEAEISDRDSIGRRGTFDLHHFNVLGNYLLNAQARVFGEVEWEHGADFESFERRRSSSGFVRLERAWFEYAFSGKIKLRVGKFLTPYGIYNEIHDAAPAYDTSILPNSLYGRHRILNGDDQRLYAKFAIGLQVLGKLEFGQSAIEYRALISNGRGESPFEQDDNSDKGIGLRLIAHLPSTGLRLGYSLYTDKNGLASNTRQTSHAWDAHLEWNRWRLTGEFAHSRLDPTSGDLYKQIANGGYAELSYILFKNQTLLVRYDLLDPDSRQVNDLQRDLTVGMNIRIIKQALVKAEVHFWETRGLLPENFVLAIASLAVVF